MKIINAFISLALIFVSTISAAVDCDLESSVVDMRGGGLVFSAYENVSIVSNRGGPRCQTTIQATGPTLRRSSVLNDIREVDSYSEAISIPQINFVGDQSGGSGMMHFMTIKFSGNDGSGANDSHQLAVLAGGIPAAGKGASQTQYHLYGVWTTFDVNGVALITRVVFSETVNTNSSKFIHWQRTSDEQGMFMELRDTAEQPGVKIATYYRGNPNGSSVNDIFYPVSSTYGNLAEYALLPLISRLQIAPDRRCQDYYQNMVSCD